MTTSVIKAALHEAHEFISLFTSGNAVPREITSIAKRIGPHIAKEAERIRDDFIWPARAELLKQVKFEAQARELVKSWRDTLGKGAADRHFANRCANELEALLNLRSKTDEA